MNTPIWRTWDRSPSEPNFRDYTYLSYKGNKIHTFDTTLDFCLTKHLNEYQVEVQEDNFKPVVDAFIYFENEAHQICQDINKQIEDLKQKRNERITQLGNKIALNLEDKTLWQ